MYKDVIIALYIIKENQKQPRPTVEDWLKKKKWVYNDIIQYNIAKTFDDMEILGNVY